LWLTAPQDKTWSELAAMATVRPASVALFDTQPTRILKSGVTVMFERTRDEMPAI